MGEVLAALYNHAKVDELAKRAFSPFPITKEDAEKIAKIGGYIKCLQGRTIMIDFSEDTIDTRTYDKYNGYDTSKTAIKRLKMTGEVTPVHRDYKLIMTTSTDFNACMKKECYFAHLIETEDGKVFRDENDYYKFRVYGDEKKVLKWITDKGMKYE